MTTGVAKRRALYSAAELEPLINPRTMAVIGASASGKGFGGSALRELVSADTKRAIYSIHPRFANEGSASGVIGVPSISALPEPVDCLMVAVPAPGVESALLEAADRGCRSAIIFSAGFGEVENGHAAEARLGEIAHRTGMRLAGPNTAGILNYHARLPLTFVPELQMDLPSGNLAIVSQSAGLATHLGHRRRRGLGVSYTMATGNSVDVTALDYVNFLLDDDKTDVVLLVLEGLDNPEGLAALGRKSRQVGKPILALKTGRTIQGGRAAISHTGSLVGSYDVFVQAAEDAGIPLFKTTEELIETGQLFARWAHKPYCRGGGVGVLTTMGGPGVMSADAAEDHGISLASPSEQTLERLRELIPAFAAMGNPIDTTASPTDDVLRQCLEAIAADENYSAVVMLAASQTGPSTAQRPAAIASAARNTDKPICAVWLSSWLEAPSSEVLDAEQSLPVFRSSDRCMLAIAHWIKFREDQLSPVPPEDAPTTLSADESKKLRGLISDYRECKLSGPLSEAASREVMGALGARLPGAVEVKSAAEAVLAANSIGFPVVAKIVAPNVPHKAKAGGVKVALNSGEEVERAFEAIMRDVPMQVPDAEIHGVLIAEMIRGGDEFMCGMVRDSVFGPVVLCGAGGGDVEELADIGRCVGPITYQKAVRALKKVRLFQRLEKRSPESARHLQREMADLMCKLGALAAAEPDIVELDLNPIVLKDDSALVSLDALVVLR